MIPEAPEAKQTIRFCDLTCSKADFSRVNALDGSCRTFQSLWCKQLKRHVTKNAPCEALYGRRRPKAI